MDFTNSTVANLTVDNTYVTAPQVSITTAATITGNLVLTQGTLALATAGSANYVIDGNVSGAGTLDAHLVASGNSVTVGGYMGTSGAVLAALSAPAGTLNVGTNWDVTALTNNNGTVSFTGAGPHTLYAGADFYNVSYAVAGGTLTFESGQTFGVAGQFLITGATGSLIVLQGSAASPWTLNDTGTTNVSFASVTYSTANTVVTPGNSFDAGNNTNWNFGGSALTWLTGGTSSVNAPTNWSGGFVPGPSNAITIPPGGTQPVQDVNLSVVGMTVQAGAVWDVAGKTLSVTTTYSNIGTLKAVGSALESVTLPAGASAGAVTFYGTTGGLGLSGMTKFGALSFNGVGGSWTLSAAITAASVTLTAGSVTVNGNGLGVTGAVTSAVGTTLTLQGGEVVTFGSTALSGAVMYDGTANYTGTNLVLGDAYSTLTFNGTGGQWKDSALNVSGSLTITTGTLVLADGTHAITANVSGAGTLDAHLVATGSVTVGGYLGTSGTPLATLSAPAGTLNVGSNWDVTTYTANSGTVVFTGTGTIFTSSAFYNLSKSTGGVTSYSAGIALSVGNNLTVSAGTLVLADIAGTQTVGGNVSGAAGTLDAHLVAGGHVLSVAGYVGTAGTTLANLLAPAGVLNVGGDVDIATSFTSDNGTVELSGATPANVAGLSFFNLIISKAAQAVTR